MESSALFKPPIEYKDDYNILYTHANPIQSHYTPHTEPLDTRAVRQHALHDQRRLHIRRTFDLLQLMLLRRDMDRAGRCLHILLKSQEWRPLELWKWGLQVMTLSDGESDSALQYLQRVSRTRPVLRPFTVPYLIREWIVCGNYQKAHDELINVITSYPHRQNPQLHTYLGLLTLYAASVHVTLPNTSDFHSPLVPTSIPASFPVQARQTAKVHFENALKMAPKYLENRNHIIHYRAVRHNRRMNRLKSKAKTHRHRLWKHLRQAGWMFREASPECTASFRQQTASSDDSSLDGSIQPPCEAPALPPSDFYGLVSDFNDVSSLHSDSDTGENCSAPEEFLSEGPAPAPTSPLDHPTTSSRDNSDTETEPLKEELQAPITVSIPAVTWSIHVARIYLRMVRWIQTDTSWIIIPVTREFNLYTTLTVISLHDV